jgi:hypothetical protein
MMTVQWNDFISSVRVPAGLSALLREDNNYGGGGLRITGPADIACLSQWNFNDLTSSMRIGEQACQASVTLTLMIRPFAPCLLASVSPPAAAVYMQLHTIHVAALAVVLTAFATVTILLMAMLYRQAPAFLLVKSSAI